MTTPTVTYDEARRRGTCSCGAWTTYGVSIREFEKAKRRHLAWHAGKEAAANERFDRALTAAIDATPAEVWEQWIAEARWNLAITNQYSERLRPSGLVRGPFDSTLAEIRALPTTHDNL